MKKSFTIINFAFALIALCAFIFNTSASFAGTPFNMQDMDNLVFPPSGWQVSNTAQYNWIRTSYCSGYGQGTASAMCDFYDYASGNLDLITSTIPVTTAGDSLVFDHAYATANTGAPVDRLDIYTSTNGGSSWTLLISLAGGAGGPLVTHSPTDHLFVPAASEWATKRYVLPVGTNKIKFEGVTAFGNNLYLDNIKIGTRFNNDVGADAIVAPKWGMAPASVTPKASVRNYGNTTQSFSVTMTISPGGYTNTQSVSNLAPGGTSLLTFSNFSFAATNTYTVKAFSTLGSDQNMANDTITSTVVVTNSPRNIVLEYITGTWCQWCPCGDNEARNLFNAYPNTVEFAYHGGSDPYINFNGNNIIGLFGFPGYPSGLIDRRYGSVNSGWGSFFTDGEYRYSQSPAATVNVAVTSSNYNSGTRQLTVNLNATALSTLSGQYKVTYVITESNLVYNQTGNGFCPGSTTWVHDNVVRTMVNGASGDNVNTGTWNTGQVYPLTFTTILPSAWVSNNCNYNVIIFKDNGAMGTDEVQQGSKAQIDPLTGINNENNGVPVKYVLEQNYPNPFNPTTNIHFSIPKDGNVSLKIYNTLGQLVATQLDGFVKAGNYNAEIEASDFASGVYYYTLSSKDFIQTKKMILVK
jgi:hypothetical protein